MNSQVKEPKFNPKSIKKMEYTVVISVLVFTAVFVAVSFYAGIEEVKEKLSLISPSMWAILLGLSLINYMARGMKWHIFGNQLTH